MEPASKAMPLAGAVVTLAGIDPAMSKALPQPGRQVELTMVGTAGDHFMGRTRSQILIGNTSDLPDSHPRSHETFTILPGWRRARK